MASIEGKAAAPPGHVALVTGASRGVGRGIALGLLTAGKSGAFDLSTSESPQFIGRVIFAPFRDPNRMARTGQVLVAAAVAKELGVLASTGARRRP